MKHPSPRPTASLEMLLLPWRRGPLQSCAARMEWASFSMWKHTVYKRTCREPSWASGFQNSWFHESWNFCWTCPLSRVCRLEVFGTVKHLLICRPLSGFLAQTGADSLSSVDSFHFFLLGLSTKICRSVVVVGLNGQSDSAKYQTKFSPVKYYSNKYIKNIYIILQYNTNSITSLPLNDIKWLISSSRCNIT